MKPRQRAPRNTTPARAAAAPMGPAAPMPRGAKTPRIHGDSSQAPRLRVAHTWWSLIGLPRGGPEWSMEEKFARVKAAGFEGIEIWVEEKDETRYRKLLDQTGLYLGIGGHPNTIEDFRRLIAQGKRLRAEYLIVHVAHAFMGNEAVAKLVRTGYRIAAGEGLPMMLETHRATVTENLYRTYELLERVPEVRLTGDFSHYVLGGDMGDLPVAERIERLRPLFARVDSMHARVSNGQQVQVDVGAGNGPLAQTWVEIWAETLRHWRKRAQAGDWFPFASELGPPPYAILDLQGGELSDRWEQSLVMKSLIELAWVKSQA